MLDILVLPIIGVHPKEQSLCRSIQFKVMKFIKWENNRLLLFKTSEFKLVSPGAHYFARNAFEVVFVVSGNTAVIASNSGVI